MLPEIVTSDITVHINREKSPPELYVSFSRGVAHFRSPIEKLLKERGIRRMTDNVIDVIEEVAPRSATILIKSKKKARVNQIDPKHLIRWADRVVERLEYLKK